jgi:hypothetical protein
MVECAIAVEPWELKLLGAGMESKRVGRLAHRFRDLEDGPTKWAAIGDEIAQAYPGRPDRTPAVTRVRSELEELRARVAELELLVGKHGQERE